MVMTVGRLSPQQYDTARQRLRIWRGSQAGASSVAQFARYLASRDFCVERIPDGFLWGWESALRDFQRERPDLSLSVLKEIHGHLFPIAKVIFPQEFVVQVWQAQVRLKPKVRKD